MTRACMQRTNISIKWLRVELHDAYIQSITSRYMMEVPDFIDGVLIHHEETYESNSKEDLQFSYHQYNFPRSALKPGAFSPLICILNRLLKLRILYMHIPLKTSTSRHVDPDMASFFFRRWLYDLSESRVYWTRHIVFFRDDLKPLYPKQAEVLWRFCDRLFMITTPPVVRPSILTIGLMCMIFWMKALKYAQVGTVIMTAEFMELMSLSRHVWEEYCTIDNFNAFFELYRRARLLGGHSCWSNVTSPCDL